MIGRAFMAGLIALLLSLPITARAQQWCMDPASSRLGFTASWEGHEFEGIFKKFDANISFDPLRPELGAIEVAVSTPSAATGNRERDEGMADPEWFDYATYPQSRYVASSFRSVGLAAYQASGSLTLKGVSRPVDLHFSWTPAGPTAIMEGQAHVSRVDFGIGTGDWADEEFVAHAVTIFFRLELSPCVAQ